MRLFISYARSDEPFARNLAERLGHAHDVWYDESLAAGQGWQQATFERLDWCECFLYVLSPDSLASKRCIQQYRKATQLDKPVVLVRAHAGVTMPDDRQYVDFAGVSFGAALADLLTVLGEVAPRLASRRVGPIRGGRSGLPGSAPRPSSPDRSVPPPRPGGLPGSRPGGSPSRSRDSSASPPRPGSAPRSGRSRAGGRGAPPAATQPAGPPASVDSDDKAVPAPEAEEEALPDWLFGEEPPAQAAGAMPAADQEEALPDWLRGEEPPARPSASPAPLESDDDATPAPFRRAEEAPPDWLRGEEPPAPAAGAMPAAMAEAEEAEEEELPAWLREEPEASEADELPTGLQAPAEAADAGLDDFLKAVEPASPSEMPEPTPTPAAAPEVAGDVGKRLGQAREQMAGGEVAGAETVADLEGLVEKKEVGPEVLQKLGDALFAQGRTDEALDMYTRALDQLGTEPVVEEEVEAEEKGKTKPEFSAFYPGLVEAGQSYALMAFVHGEDATEQVRAIATGFAGLMGKEQESGTAASRLAVSVGDLITFVPRIAGITFAPAEGTVVWQPPFQYVAFPFTTPAPLEGDLSGRVLVYQGPIIIGEIPVRMRAVASAPQGVDQQGTFERYDPVFASYSHRDRPVMEFFRQLRIGLGQRMLVDIYDLRAGDHWSERLLEMIDESAVFQLFWSRFSAESPYCRREWEHALGYQEARPRFIQPVWWQHPMPDPPPELADLHFQKIAIPVRTRIEVAGSRVRDWFSRG